MVTAADLLPFAVTIVRAEDKLDELERRITANGERLGELADFRRPLAGRGADTLISEIETYLAAEAR